MAIAVSELSGATAARRPAHAHLDQDGHRFLRRLTLATGGGMFMDGFVFATFAAALAGQAHERLGVTPLWDSLISASVLMGTFVGGLTLGYLTDRIGRRPMFTADMLTFLVCAGLLFFVTDAWQVFAIGLVMGLAVGADYSIGSPLLGEFSPAAMRGHFLGLLEILWNVGYVVAYLVGFVVNSYAPGAWRLIMAATVVPAIVCLLLRHGLPESPRWLAAKGRQEEARQIMRDALGEHHVTVLDAEEEGQTRMSVLFGPDYLRRTLFCCIFWSGIVLPYFALTFFQPMILRTMGLGDNALAGALLGVLIALSGAATGWYLVDRVGRRRILILPMFACAFFLAVTAANELVPPLVSVGCFFGYLYSYGVMSILSGIYPEEVFPSAVRATGVGVATAGSRAAAAAGTFGLPLLMTSIGLSGVLLIMAAVSALVGVVCILWAPETNGKELTHTAQRVDPHRYRGQATRP